MNGKEDYAEIKKKIVKYIGDFSKNNSVIIGLSGGIDSSIVCALAIEALGEERVKALIVKNSRYLLENLRIAEEYAQNNGLNIKEIDTEEMRKDAAQRLGISESDIIQNATLDARICDNMLRTVAGLEDRVYLGTINGTERLTGWYPKGALVGDVCPIGGLLKEQEKGLAKEMGLVHLIGTISDDASKVCSGCGELPEFKGIPYEILDKVLHIYETSKGDELPRRLLNHGIDREISSKILRRVNYVEHKNDVFPSFCKINYPGESK